MKGVRRNLWSRPQGENFTALNQSAFIAPKQFCFATSNEFEYNVFLEKFVLEI